MAEFLILLLLPGVVAFAAAMDLFTMTIPNRVSIVMAVAFFPAAWVAGLEWLAIADHLAAGLIVLAVGVGLFALGWFGGGDAKLDRIGRDAGSTCVPHATDVKSGTIQR